MSMLSPRLRFRPSLLALAVLAGVASAPHETPAPVVIRPGEAPSYVPSGVEVAPDAKSAQGQFEIAQRFEAAGNTGAAIQAYRKVARRFPKSTYAANSLYKAALLLEKTGDMEGAYKAYVKLNKDYPRSNDFSNSIEGQMRVGASYLEGRRQRILGVPTLPSMTRAADIYSAIVKNAPYSRFAPEAQFRLGLAKEKSGDSQAAINAYQAVIDKYPLSDWTDDAMFQIGYVYMKVMRGGSYDRNAAKYAKEYFEDFIQTYPKHEKAAQARQYLASLGQVQGRSSLKTAQYYDKQGAYVSAVMLYNEVVRSNVGTKDAEVAGKRLAALRVKLGEKFFENPMLVPGKPDARRVAEIQGRTTPGGQPIPSLPPSGGAVDAPLPAEPALPPGVGGPDGPGEAGPAAGGFDSSNPFDAPTSPLAPGSTAPLPPAPEPPAANPAPTP